MKTACLVRTIILVGSLLLQWSTLCLQSWSAAAGDVDLSFDAGSGVNGRVNALALQPDGKVLIGGQFTTVKGLVRTNLARLNADGSGDGSFSSPPLNYAVHSLALQPDGKVLVGSENDNFGLTRVNSDGSPDTSFNGNAYAAIVSTEPYYPVRVDSIVVQPDGKVLYAGERLLRLNANGTRDIDFALGPFGDVSSMSLQPDGKLIIGFNDGNSIYGLFRVNANGTPDNSFVAPVAGIVNAIVLQPDGKVIFGGLHTTVNGTNRTPIARLTSNGSVDASFGLVSGTGAGVGEGGSQPLVDAIALQLDGKLVIGGSFDSIQGRSRRNLARLNTDGSLDSSFPNAEGGAGGFPTTAPGTAVKAIVRQPDGRILIAGAFTTVNETNRNRLARLHADGSLDSSFHPGRGVGNPVGATVMVANGKVMIGSGSPIATVGGTSAMVERLRLDGSSDPNFHPGSGANDAVVAVAPQPDGKVLIGGSFTTVRGTNRSSLARLNVDGSLDAGFKPPLDVLAPHDPIPHPYGGEFATAVTAVRVQADGRILVAGYGLTLITGEEVFSVSMRHFLLRLEANGDQDVSFQWAVGDQVDGGASWFFAWYSYPPSALVLQPDGKIVVGGYFRELNGTSRNGIARLNADGTLDSSFVPSTSVPVGAIALQPDGKMLVGGGYFGEVNGFHTYGITRLNWNGSRDATFNPGTGTDGLSGQVHAIALLPDGKVLIGGSFTSFNRMNRNRIARLNTDGGLDSHFNPAIGADGTVRSMTLQTDGKILIGGDFLTVNGVLRPHLARLYGELAVPSLSIARSDGLVTVSWPVTASTFHLQETTELSLPKPWSPVAHPAVTNAGQISVIVPITVGSRVFRLQAQ